VRVPAAGHYRHQPTGEDDGADDKFDAIVEKLVGPEKEQVEMMVKRSDVREILGTRNLQEIIFK